MTTTPPVRLTRKQLAARLCVQPGTLAHWACVGKGPKFIILGNSRAVYDLAEVERWEASRTHQSTAEYDSGNRGERFGREEATA